MGETVNQVGSNVHGYYLTPVCTAGAVHFRQQVEGVRPRLRCVVRVCLFVCLFAQRKMRRAFGVQDTN